MQKFIRALCLFLLVCGVSYCILLIIWGRFAAGIIPGNLNYKKGSNSYMYTRLKEVEVYGKVDILFLGSSHTYRGFDNRIFEKHGIRSFNLGSSAQTPIQTNLLLKRYLERLNPGIIIYEVYPKTFCSDGIESSLDIIANSKNDLEAFKMAIKQQHIKVYNTFLYGFMNDRINGNFTSVEDTNLGSNYYVKGGYVGNNLAGEKNFLNSEKKLWKLDSAQIKAFGENVSIIKNKKIKLLLVQAPIAHSLYNSYTNNSFFDKCMKDYSAYYNYNGLLNLSDSFDFYDEDHLNQSGVNIFNEALIKDLNFGINNKK